MRRYHEGSSPAAVKEGLNSISSGTDGVTADMHGKTDPKAKEPTGWKPLVDFKRDNKARYAAFGRRDR